MKTALILVLALAVLVAGVASAGGILEALGEVKQQDIAKERVKVSIHV